MNLSDKVLNVACDYWCKTIKGGKGHDNGDKSMTSIFASLLANSATNTISDDKLNIFKEELKKQIPEYWEKYGYESREYLYLYCDYGPSFVLNKAAEKADINTLNFPWKTGIFIYTNAVIEIRPYNRPENETDAIIYCEKGYIVDKIASTEKYIEELKVREPEKWETENDIKDILECEIKLLGYYKDFLNKMGEEYIKVGYES